MPLNQKNDTLYIKNFFLSSQRLEQESEQLKERLEREKPAKKSTEGDKSADKQFKRIQRGFSAKRYLNNLTKNWDQSVLDTFVTEGKIKNVDKPVTGSKRKLSHDLTRWPQAYRIDQNWASAAIDMKSYKFIKADEFNISSTRKHGNYEPREELQKHEKSMSKYESPLASYQSMDEDEKPYQPKSKKKKSALRDPIKVFDEQHKEVSYKNLATEEKEKVLSQILFHSAMNNIMEMVSKIE